MLQPNVNSNDRHLGNKDALITIVEFGDFECPHCGRAHPLLQRLLKEHDGELHFVFKNDSWVEVIDGADATLHRQRNKAGTELKVKGTPPLQLVVGAASGVQLRAAVTLCTRMVSCMSAVAAASAEDSD